MITAEEISHKLSPLFDEAGLQLAILFGSVVTGSTHKKSDIDLAFLFDAPLDILDLTNKVIRILHADNVDVVDLRKASPLLRFSAIKHGKVLYESKPGIFNAFVSLAFRKFIDTKKFRDAQALSIKLFLHERGVA